MSKFRRNQRRGQRRRRFQRRGYGQGMHYKSVAKKGNSMVNRSPARLHNVISPHYFTKLDACFTGVLGTTALQTQNWTVKGSSLYLPFNTGASFTSMTGATLVPATVALSALYPIGFHQLCNSDANGGLYNEYRVYASKISVNVTPTNGADAIWFCVYPVPEIGNTPVTDFQQAMALPYSKAIQVTGSNNVKQNTISLYMDSADAVGLTKQQLNNLSPAQYSTDPPNAGLFFYNIVYQKGQAGVLNAPCNVMVKVTYWVEFLGPNQLKDT